MATYAPLSGKDYHSPIDPTITRDFDNGMGNLPDGAYINKADEGEGEDVVPGAATFSPLTPHFDFGDAFKYEGVAPAYHVPRRMAPSPIAFGSIPSAVQTNAPWTCLLFRPNVSELPHLGEPGNGLLFEENHKTLENFQVPQMASVTGDPTLPPDHLWLDYFWMPTVEPSHVITPFATHGKMNLNYQMLPFTHIKRATVLKAEEILAIPTSAGQTHKSSQDNPNWRHRIDATETLKQFEEKFEKGEIFMTESEVCEQFLIPEGQMWDADGASIRAFWDAHRLSGDNTLERPYAGLYSRVTTRSNVFRLHYRIQLIAKSGGPAPGHFDPEQDTITEDQRGAMILERVLDHSSPNIPNYQREHADPASLPRLEQLYQFRVRED